MFKESASNAKTNFPLSPKKIIKKTMLQVVVFSWGFIFLLVMSAPFSQYLSRNLGINISSWLVLIIVFLYIVNILFCYLYERWYFLTYYYELTENFVLIKKGVLATKEITIPYEKIQDVYVDQDIFDRMFGLFDVHLSSATMSSSWLAHIDGVEQAGATGIKEALLQKLQQKKQGYGSIVNQ